MEKFEEVKIGVVMKAENVSRERAIEIIAERCSGRTENQPVKDGGSISFDADKVDWMSAEEFFGAD